MKVKLALATTQVDPVARVAYSPAALLQLKADLDARSFPITFRWRDTTVGGTEMGTALVAGGRLTVAAFLAPAFMAPGGAARAVAAGAWAVIANVERIQSVDDIALHTIAPRGTRSPLTLVVTKARLRDITVMPVEFAPGRPKVIPWEPE